MVQNYRSPRQRGSRPSSDSTLVRLLPATSPATCLSRARMLLTSSKAACSAPAAAPTCRRLCDFSKFQTGRVYHALRSMSRGQFRIPRNRALSTRNGCSAEVNFKHKGKAWIASPRRAFTSRMNSSTSAKVLGENTRVCVDELGPSSPAWSSAYSSRDPIWPAAHMLNTGQKSLCTITFQLASILAADIPNILDFHESPLPWQHTCSVASATGSQAAQELCVSTSPGRSLASACQSSSNAASPLSFSSRMRPSTCALVRSGATLLRLILALEAASAGKSHRSVTPTTLCQHAM